MTNLNSRHRKLETNVVASADEVNLRKEKCDDKIPGCVGLGAECASFPTNSVLASGNNVTLPTTDLPCCLFLASREDQAIVQFAEHD